MTTQTIASRTIDSASSASRSGARTQAVTAAFLAALFGATLLYGTGFAQPAAMHNAAHDARHAFAFPCH